MKKPLLILILLLMLAGILCLSYCTDRSNFFQLFALYSGLFGLYIAAFRMNLDGENFQVSQFAGIFFRVVLLFSIPNLSDDFYRFYWDGLLLSNGISPFANLPTDFISGTEVGHGISGINAELFQNLNSKAYFTIYPPICQFVFWVSAMIFPNSLTGATVVMKIFILLFEICSIFLIPKLLQSFKMRKQLSLLYTLNPLVIVELTGNIHFEAGMIFFSLLAVWLLVKNKKHLSAVAMAMAVCTKLLPLIFLPFILRRLSPIKSKKTGIAEGHFTVKKESALTNNEPFLFFNSAIYYLIVGVVCVMMFLPLLDISAIKNMASSVDLYFQKFEFNASIYYIIRKIGFWIKGWNVIQTVGPYLGLFTFVSIIGVMFFEKLLSLKNLLVSMMWALFIYLSLSTIVHPWYITSLVALCIFSKYRFPIVWTCLIPLSYYTYLTNAYTENLWLVAIQYGILAAFIVYEYFCHKAQEKQFDSFCQLERSCVLKLDQEGS